MKDRLPGSLIGILAARVESSREMQDLRSRCTQDELMTRMLEVVKAAKMIQLAHKYHADEYMHQPCGCDLCETLRAEGWDLTLPEKENP